ncbi:MAG: hypothetical protein AAFP86_07815 [Planctomycetota bacterium]
MPSILLFLVALPLGLLLGCGSGASEPFINGRALTADELEGFRSMYGVVPQPGRYWYDPMSGIWGLEGGPAAGFLLPGLPFGAPSEDAAGGDSPVVVNGRRLPMQEVLSWQWMLGTQVMPGRYWLDHQGNYGVEGFPMPAGNLMVLLARGGGGRGRDNFWTSRVGAGNHDPVTGAGYVSVPGHGPIGYGM